MYDWVIQWAERPSAPIALFCLAFAESSFFLVPPDFLLIPLVLGARKKWFKLALITTLGSFLGGMFGYFIGWKLWWTFQGEFTPVANFFFNVIPGFSKELFESIQVQYNNHNFLIVFTAGFTPIPYKLITITSGACKINFIIFAIASAVSRGARFFLVSFLIYLFGEKMREFIDKYFDWLALLLTALLIGGFVVIKYVL